jgi:hypothetical protein
MWFVSVMRVEKHGMRLLILSNIETSDKNEVPSETKALPMHY